MSKPPLSSSLRHSDSCVLLAFPFFTEVHFDSILFNSDFVEEIAIIVVGADVHFAIMYFDEADVAFCKRLSKIPGLFRIMWFTRFLHTPASIAHVNDPGGVYAIVANGVRAFVGVVVMFKCSLNAIFFEKRRPVFANLLLLVSIKIAHRGVGSDMINHEFKRNIFATF